MKVTPYFLIILTIFFLATEQSISANDKRCLNCINCTNYTCSECRVGYYLGCDKLCRICPYPYSSC